MLSARSRTTGDEDKWEEYVRGRRRDMRKHKHIGKRWRFFEWVCFVWCCLGYHFLLKRIRIALMLSMPYWLLLSFETSSSSSSSKISLLLLLFLMRFPTHSTIYALLLISQIPSHPIIINSKFSFFMSLQSGSAVIICYSGFKFPRLYSKSPSALDKLSPPFTLPKLTVPPAFVILSSSSVSSGLWSLLSG